MLVDVTQTLKNMNGQTMKDMIEEVDDKGKKTAVAIDATVKMAIVNALLAPVQKESGVDKVKKYELAKKVYASDDVDLNEDEIKLIKERVGECLIPLVVGRIYDLLKV